MPMYTAVRFLASSMHLWIVFLHFSDVSSAANPIDLIGCGYDEKFDDVTISITRGWPAAPVDCDALASNLFDSSRIECYIFNEEMHEIHNYSARYDGYTMQSTGASPYTVPYMSRDRNLTVIVKSIYEDVCYYNNVFLRITEATYQNQNDCKSVLNQAVTEGTYTKKQYTCGSNFYVLQCDSDDVFLEPGSYNVTWYRDCAPLDRTLYDVTVIKETGTTIYSKLKLPDEEVSASTYSCQVHHNGLSQYLRHHQVCFKGRQDFNEPSILPSSDFVETTVGSDVTLQCFGSGGISLSFYWYKKTIPTRNASTIYPLCSLSQTTSGSNSSYGRFDCYENSTLKQREVCGESINCAGYQPIKFSTNLVIRNIQESDVGEYVCIGTATSGNVSSEIKLRLQQVTVAAAGLLTVLVAIAAGFLFGVVVFGLIIWCLWTDLRLIWKKYCAKYDEDDRSFAVFLSYSFKRDEKSNDVKELLHKLHNWFDLNNYNVFDQHHSNAGELHYNLIQEMVPDSHRMLILMTSAYLESEIDLFDAQTGIMSYINGDTKLIFVLVPEVQVYIEKKLKCRDPTCQALLMAMKQSRNTVILWNGNKRQHKFFKTLDVAMPKLRSEPLVIKNNQRKGDGRDSPRGNYKGPVKTVTSLVIENDVNVI